MSKYHGWYYISRDNQHISNSYSFYRFDDELIMHMQQLIDDIESGRYNNKKTLKEEIKKTVENRRLTGYMNKTKWNELLNEINTDIREIQLKYKTLFEKEEPEYYWTIYGDEDIEHMNMAMIEWMKFKPVFEEKEYQGRLIKPKVNVINMKEQLVSILKKYNIPYEYDEDEKIYIVYGYK